LLCNSIFSNAGLNLAVRRRSNKTLNNIPVFISAGAFVAGMWFSWQ